MKAAVVDASVAVKWVIAEAHSDRALLVLRQAMTLHAPSHWLAEAANALWAKVSVHHVLSAAEMRTRLGFLSSLPIIVAPLPDLVGMAGDLSLDLGLTVYDTLYLALAEKVGAPLITADRKLHERASARFAGRLCWIGDVGEASLD